MSYELGAWSYELGAWSWEFRSSRCRFSFIIKMAHGIH